MISFIDFDESVYDDAVSGVGVARFCNKKYKPSHTDRSFDTVVEENDLWFIKRDFLTEFFSILSQGSFPPISIVTQHSDYEVDDQLMGMKPNCVKIVFGSNNIAIRDDSVPIPLGLGPPFGHGAPLAEDIKRSETKGNRDKLLYVNFRPHTFPAERMPLLSRFSDPSCKWATIGRVDSTCQHFDGYLSDLTSHKFSLCPRGNGIDTHRLWESLYARTVPVVKYHPAHRSFRDLPILFVDDWSIVTEDFLNSEYERMASCKWDYSMLRASWWEKEFKRRNYEQ